MSALTKQDARIIALDIGAESGRAMLGHFDGERISLEEVHRFPNGPVRVGSHLFIDVLQIWEQIQAGLKKGLLRAEGRLDSLGVDTWGVDYALLERRGNLLQNPYHYRDRRTSGILDQIFKIIPADQLYLATGNQLEEFNTLFQLFASQRDEAHILENARALLMLPDLFHYWLCGEKAGEYCISTTTQCFQQTEGRWAYGLLEKLGIPPGLFQEVALPGTRLGSVRDFILPSSRPKVPVILPSGHDTGCAVTAVPVQNDNFLYISSGTWSLVGTELDQPLISYQSLKHNFTNEGKLDGRTRFLKIVPGMWLFQQCKREWQEAGREYTYEQLVGMAAAAPECGPIIDVAAPEFLDPGDMPRRIQAFCRRSGQPIPQSEGETIRCIFESLAYLYRSLLEGFEEILGRKLEVIHIIGGGSRNALLNQLTANITCRLVIAGPVEATAAGNILIQAMGLRYLASLEDIRQVVKNSFPLVEFLPFETNRWNEGFQEYLKILSPNV